MELFHKICAAYGQEYNSQRAIFYFENLAQYSFNEIKKAFYCAVNECRFFPTLADVKKFLITSSVAHDWQNVLRVARNGGIGWEDLADKTVAVVAEIGGLGRIQNANDKDLHFIFNQFERTHKNIANTQVEFRTRESKLNMLNPDRETMSVLNDSVHLRLLRENLGQQ